MLSELSQTHVIGLMNNKFIVDGFSLKRWQVKLDLAISKNKGHHLSYTNKLESMCTDGICVRVLVSVDLYLFQPPTKLIVIL